MQINYCEKEIEFYKLFKKTAFIFNFIILPCFTFAQASFIGTVTTKNGNSRIAYATVGLVLENIGTNTNENGDFRLQSKTISTIDTLRISSVGYETLKVPVDQLPVSMQFQLLQKETTLKELIIKSTKKQGPVTLNSASNCGSDYYTTNGNMTQMAQHFHLDHGNAFLEEVEICKYGIAIIDPVKTIFRIRIYERDSVSGKPLADLTDSVIEVKAEGRHVVIDLKKYNIHIPGKDFFVAVEWLRIAYNAYREKMKLNGTTISTTSYTPSIAFKRNNAGNISALHIPEVWMQMYSGKWLPMYNVSRMMIAATIKY
ncbi:MAG: carboxypeptidase-like regulatory domain-containing protein [Ferruginibacter sp.]